MATLLKDRTILLAKSGSRAYGMHRPDSDVDLQGIVIPPKEYFLGFANRIEQFGEQPTALCCGFPECFIQEL